MGSLLQLSRADHRSQTNADLTFSAILSSFPNLGSLDLINAFPSTDTETRVHPSDESASLRNTSLEAHLSLVSAETTIKAVELREEAGRCFVRC